MIDKTTLIPAVLQKAKKLPVNHCIDVRTYKRDRSVLIVKLSIDVFLVKEDGFYQEEFEVPLGKLSKLLKTLLKKEFPRSHKVRLYDLGEYSPEKFAGIARKKI